MQQLPPGFAPTYGVDLLCEQPSPVWKPRLLDALRRHCPAVEPLAKDGDSNLLAFIHPDHIVHYSDGRVPAQTFIHPSDQLPDPELLSASLQQSWTYPHLKAAVRNCTASVYVSDIMASPLPYRERLYLFQRVLAGVLDVISTVAINWRPTQQLIDPVAYLRAFKTGESDVFFAGALNVRFFRIESSDGEMLMDTLGLAALGLPDLQCHFRGTLDPNEVSRVLHNTGLYIFQNGDVVEDGQTVTGHTRWSKWACRHEEALAPPAREVLDLNPGKGLAAGNR